MKKVISLLIILALTFGVVNVSAAPKASDVDILSLLSELKIMSGDANGDMRLNDNVTRSEFTKVAIALSKHRNSVASSVNVSPYIDVSYTHWAAPYIKLAVSNGICKGYPDSTFLPDNMVSYEEAITMLLKVLGYTDEDFGVSWPYGQVGMANSLDITANIDKGIGDALTRYDVAVMAYNTLDTKQKGTQVKLISDFDCQIIEDIMLIATNDEDPSVNSGKIVTSNGTYNIDNSFNRQNVGRQGNAVIKNGDKLISFAADAQQVNEYNITSKIGSDIVLDGSILNLDENMTTYYKSQKITYSQAVSLSSKGDKFYIYTNEAGVIQYARLKPAGDKVVIDTNLMERYVVYSMIGDDIIAYKDSVMTTLSVPDKTDAYDDSIKYTFGTLKSKLELGDILFVKRKSDNEIDYLSYEKGTVAGPVTILSQGSIAQFDTNADTVYMRNGIKILSGDMEMYDIAYFIKDLNMVLTYSNKVTGVYEKALPNKDFPKSIVVSDKTYELEGTAAFEKLSSQGKFAFGDTITLLIGKDGKVADVISSESIDDLHGYIFETGKKEYSKSDNTTYTGYYVKVALSDGTVQEYITDKDYENLKNSVARLSFTGGKAKAVKVSAQSSVFGKFSLANKSIGGTKVSGSIDILDISTLDSNKEGNFKPVFPQRIDGVNLTASTILYAEKNSDGVLTKLILNNVTGDMDSYGIVIKAQSASMGMSITGVYKYDLGGIGHDLTTNGSSFGVSSGDVAKITIDSRGTVTLMQPISKIAKEVTKVDTSYLTAGGQKYLLSDNVSVYMRTNINTYMMIPISDLINKNDYKINAYYDKPEESGGRVRVIIAS